MMARVVVCGDDPPIEHDIDEAIVVDGLCADTGRLPRSVGDASATVLALHPGGFQLSLVQRALRSLGIDPLGVQVYRADPTVTAEAATAVLNGLAARAIAYKGSEPEHAKPVPNRTYTRRALLRPPVPEYIAAPMITLSLCGASDGCRACVEVCPQGAYSSQSGRIIFDKDACQPCGQCVTSCPTSAIANPAATPSMLAAQIGTLIAGTTESVGIRFVCSRGQMPQEVGWFDVEVPCTSMVPGTWLLACIALGTGSVALVACDESGCPLGLDETALESISFARRLLTSYGLNPDLVGTGHGPVPVPLPALEVSDPFGTKGPGAVLLGLAAATGKLPVVVEAGSPVGVVEIDAATCTLCAQCATTCPTDALADRYEDGRISITFDAADCVNCRQCISACPEIERGAIAVSPRVDADLLVAGRHTLNEGSVIMCERCGNAIAPDMMMNRISDLLGDEFQNTMEFLSTRCLDCRGQG